MTWAFAPLKPRPIGSAMFLRAALAVFWFATFAIFAAWVIFGLAPREHSSRQDQPEDEQEPGELPLAA